MENYNGFPATYQPMYQPNMYYQSVTPTTPVYTPRNWQQQTALPPYQQNQQPTNNSNIIWVQGEAGAKAQNVPNGCNMAFFDSENKCVYIKSVDASGKPSLTILDYNERNSGEQPQSDTAQYATKEQITAVNDELSKFATKDEFDSLNDSINDLMDRIDEFENKIANINKQSQNSNPNNRRGNK